ncbi:hypothetical protein [Persicobacter psychrovividus]|uniref:Uncharacterized protein n=1 Tax=Persicobacter psychrovividus TaxID=387638 RepID=A0ABN6LFJ8_9BACT|nr:hypothetical protein PEPS_23970 [Persicobacter psychrovividus]
MQKFFSSDFNQQLYAIQQQELNQMLKELVEKGRMVYLQLHNPLGLKDDTVRSLEDCEDYFLEGLEEVYQLMAAIYRFNNGEYQLSFLFDGRSLEEKYQDDWQKGFAKMLFELGLNTRFHQTLLDYCILNRGNHQAAISELKRMLCQFYRLKFDLKKGITPLV